MYCFRVIPEKREQDELRRWAEAARTEFVAISGRPGIGKTHLVDGALGDILAFRREFPLKGGAKVQLRAFRDSISRASGRDIPAPEDWFSAFALLVSFLEEKDGSSRQVVFLDEIPRAGKGFLAALGGFWSTWGCMRRNLMLVVAGSDCLWMRERLRDNTRDSTGGSPAGSSQGPLSLPEFARRFGDEPESSREILTGYMASGGVPGNVGCDSPELCFERLLSSLFKRPGEAGRALAFLAGDPLFGYTRKEAAEALGEGGLARIPEALAEAGMVARHVPRGSGKRGAPYRISDPFCLRTLAGGGSPSLAFALCCFSNVAAVKKALGISGVRTRENLWRARDGEIGEGLPSHTPR